VTDDAQNAKLAARLLEQRGTASQRERWAVGLLPEDELLALARDVLFAPFAPFARWRKLMSSDIVHRQTCNGGTVTFSTRQPADLSAEEWAILKKITTAATAGKALFREHGTTATVDLVEHVGSCFKCKAEVFGRSASVRLEWAGRPLSREYALEVV
jgi:hypothetical protein